MVSHRASGWESWVPKIVAEPFEQETSCTTTKKTEHLGATHVYNAKKGRVGAVNTSQPQSLLKLLFWASLFVGSRGQLTTPFPANFELSSLDGKNGFFIKGPTTNDSSAFSVSTAGDFNGDGIDDIVIGAASTDLPGKMNAGRSYVVFGSHTAFSIGVFNLSNLNGFNGFIINGEKSGGACGFFVSSAGDVNGDDISDLIIGARKADPSNKLLAGQSYVIFGSRTPISGGVLELSNLNGANGFILNGEAAKDESGRTVTTAGDVNGDGLSDILIGAFHASPLRRIKSGKSYVVFGSRTPISGGVLELSNLDGQNGFELNGEFENDISGRSVSTAGDFNGDGIDDLVIGAPGAEISGNNNVGKSYLVYGNRQLVSMGSLDLSNLKVANGFILNGEFKDGRCGGSVSSAGDMNGDGFADILLGAANASPLGRSEAGRSYVVFGNSTTNKRVVFKLSSLNGSNGFVINGENKEDLSGVSVSSAGDVNGDGLSDIVIGANRATPLNRYQAGKSYIIFGSSIPIRGGVLELSSLNGKNGFIIHGESAGDKSGGSVSSAGDVNGDGITDIMIGDQGSTTFQVNFTGVCYVIFGRNLTQKFQKLPLTTDIDTSQQLISSSTELNPISQQLSIPTLLTPSFLQSTSSTINLILTEESKAFTLPKVSQKANSTLFVAGIVTAVTAFAFSFIGGVLLYIKNRNKRSTPLHGTSLDNSQPGPSADEYDKLPPPAQIYDQVVVAENENQNYDIVNVKTRDPDHEYECPLSPL